MGKSFTILHLSDLHKDSLCSYDDLMESLINDNSEYIKNGVPPIGIIVVSGDIAEGAVDPDAEKKIRAQYNQSKDFLEKLVKTFLDNDRRRLIMVPGNHDVNWQTSYNSMTDLTRNRKAAYEEYKMGPESGIRWSWDTFKFRKISNDDLYRERFKCFVDFYNDFYKGIPEYQIDEECEEKGYVYDLPEFNISFLALNSCKNLDDLNDMGAIEAHAVSSNASRLRELNEKGRLLCAVWHHHISGLPSQHNYLDFRILNTLMQYNVQIGFFGHQHMNEVLCEYNDIVSERSMLLISAGCLYGNAKQLPPGTTRQYNLVSVNINDASVNLEIRVRKDISKDLFKFPQWSEGTVGSTTKTFVEKTITLPDSFQTIGSDLFLMDASARESNHFLDAFKYMLSVRSQESMADKFIDEYLSTVKITDTELLDNFFTPNTEIQAVHLLNAAINLKDKAKTVTLMKCDLVRMSNNPAIRILREEFAKQ